MSEGPPEGSGPQAVAAAYEEHRGWLEKEVATIVGPGDAPDVVQKTFMRLCRSGPEGRSLERRWLATCVKNEARDLLRKRRRREWREARWLGELRPSKASPGDPLGQLRRSRIMELLLTELGRMPRRLRQVLKLYYLRGESIRGIAEELDLSPQTVKNELTAGRSRLAAHLRERGVEGLADV